MARHAESDREEDIRDRVHSGYRIFIGDLGSHIGKYELSKEFKNYGPINDIWVARSPAGFAFVVFKYAEDADRAIAHLNSRPLCGRRVRAELARPYRKRDGRPQPTGSGGRNRHEHLPYLDEDQTHRSWRHERSRSRSRDRRRHRSRSSSRDHYRQGSLQRWSRSNTRSRSRSASKSTSRLGDERTVRRELICSKCAKPISDGDLQVLQNAKSASPTK